MSSVEENAHAVFRTLAIRRGEQAVYSADETTLSWSILGNTAQALLDPTVGVVEHYEMLGEGVALTWVLTRPLAGKGALTVEAEVAGLSYTARTESGHHFADKSGEGRLRVGNVTVVDAVGRRWPVPMTAEKADCAKLRINVSEVILAQATYPLAIDPLITPEFGIDNPVIVPSGSDQVTPSIASNGRDFITVWQWGPLGGGADIVGVRISGTGVVLDPNGLSLSGVASGDQVSPAVASLGSDYLVVWQDSGFNPNTANIAGALVKTTGVTPEISLVSISAAALAQQAPAVAANGTDFLVVWQDARGAGVTGVDIYGARVTSAGTVLEPNGIPINTSPGNQQSPAVSSDGSHFLVVWEDYRLSSICLVYGARVAGIGAVFETTGFRISLFLAGDKFAPAVAFNGVHYLVAWQDTRTFSISGSSIYGARVRSDATVMDNTGIAISTAPDEQLTPSVTTIGSEFFVTWRDRRNNAATGSDIYGARLTSDAALRDTNGIALCNAMGDQFLPAVAANGTNYFVLWQDSRNAATSGADIYGTLVASDGTAANTNGVPLSTEINAESSPAVAGNGTNYLVVWVDQRAYATTERDIYGVRLDRSGALLDPAGIRISRNSGQVPEFDPAVASNGSDYLVAWEDFRNFGDPSLLKDIYGTRVTSAGTVLDTTGIPIGAGNGNQTAPAIAGTSSGYFVVWQAGDTGFTDIHGRSVSNDGTFPNFGMSISVSAEDQVAPAVAWGTTNYLVVWQDSRNTFTTGDDIYAARVTAAGVLLDQSGFAIATAQNKQLNPALAFNGADYFVAWQDNRVGSGIPVGSDIYGTVVSESGVVSDPNGRAIIAVLSVQAFPAVAASGDEFLVVWHDFRNGSAFNSINGDVYGSRINGNGTVMDGDGFVINNNPGNQIFPAIVPADTGRFLVISEGTLGGQSRIVGNFVSLNDPPVANSQTSTVLEDTSIALTLTGSDERNATLIFLVLSNPTNGTVSGLPPNLIYTPATNYHGPDSFEFKVNDGEADSPSAMVVITVASVNDAPVLSAILNQTLDEGVLLTVTAFASDVDLPRNSLAFTLGPGAPAGAAINPTNGVLTWRPTEAQGPGTNFITVTVTDDGSPNLTDSKTFPVIVREVNAPPAFVIDEGATLVVPNAVIDPDVPANRLTFTLGVDAPPGASINPTNGVFTWTPTEEQGPGTNVISVTVTDDGVPPLDDVKTLTVIVREVNTAPVLAPINNKAIHAGERIIVANVATDGDLPANVLRFSLSGGAPADASIDPVSGVLTWTADPERQGSHSITVMASDNGTPALTSTQSFTITVVSKPVLTIEYLADKPVLSWNALSGRSYRVQFKPSLADIEWRDLPGDVVSTGATATRADDTLGDSRQRFYRVAAMP